MTEITDIQLADFAAWYRQRFNECCMEQSVLVTCLCGHFGSNEKAMKEALKRMQSLDLIIRHRNGTISITRGWDSDPLTKSGDRHGRDKTIPR